MYLILFPRPACKMTVAKPTPPILRPLRGWLHSGPILQLGHVLDFASRAVAGIPLVLRSYRNEFTRLLSDVAWGNGSLVVGGGTAGVALVLGIVVGVMVGIEGYNFLHCSASARPSASFPRW